MTVMLMSRTIVVPRRRRGKSVITKVPVLQPTCRLTHLFAQIHRPKRLPARAPIARRAKSARSAVPPARSARARPQRAAAAKIRPSAAAVYARERVLRTSYVRPPPKKTIEARGPSQTDILTAPKREKLLVMLESSASKMEREFGEETVMEPNWPKLRGYTVIINEVLPNLTGTEPRNVDKRRPKPQFLIQALTNHSDDREALLKYVKFPSYDCTYRYCRTPKKLMSSMKELDGGEKAEEGDEANEGEKEKSGGAKEGDEANEQGAEAQEGEEASTERGSQE